MSIINNVLKSLESRESQFTPIELPELELAPVAAHDYRPLLYLGLLLILLAAAGGVYLYNRSSGFAMLGQAANGSVVAATQQVVPVPATAPVPAAPAMPLDEVIGNQIVGLQIRETETEMRLEFALRERVVAFLNERGENSFSYHLRDIKSEIVAPVMRDNRWIRTLAIKASGSGVDINFVTAPDMLVETRQRQVDGEEMWLINLRPARSQAATTVAPVKAEHSPAVAAPLPVSRATAPTTASPPAPSAPAPVPLESATEEQAVAPIKLDIKSANPSSVAYNQLEYAVELMNSGRPADAEKLLSGLVGGTSDHRAREHLIALYIRQNRSGRLRSLLLSSIAEYPQDPLFKTEYARSLFQAGAYREVIRLLVQDSALDVNQQALLAASYQRLDLHAEAIQHYRLALQLDAKNARNWVGLGISQEQSSAFVEALDSYRQAARAGGLSARLRAFVERRSDKLRQVID